MGSDNARRDGSLDFAGGINSIAVTTVDVGPASLQRNQLAWLNNGTVRDGGISPRAGWLLVGTIIDNADYLFQGNFLYDPFGEIDPYEIWVVSGNILKVDVNTGAVTNLSAQFGLTNSPTSPFAFFVQAEEFLIIQSGDGVTLPLFWDGVTLRRSIGIQGPTAPGTPGFNEIPAATCMEYYMGRVWYAEGRTFSAGDIVFGNSGTAAYEFRDAVLNVTENPIVVGGDGFAVPLQDGNIRALKSGAAIDAALGQGRLFIGTRKAWYALSVPVTRTAWIAADNDNQPLLTVVQLVNGPVNDRSCVTVNGDIFYQSLEPGIRSLDQSVRYFNQPGNRQISANEQRILQFNDRALMRASSGIVFNNRLLETALPRQTPNGIVSDAIIPMDFVPISTFGQERNPNWEGALQGVPILQLAAGDFGGRERAFAAVRSEEDGSLQLWEITQNEKLDKFADGERGNRVQWFVETPAFNFADSWGALEFKKLVGGELAVDRLIGTVDFEVDWRPDFSSCWIPWHKWSECSPRNTAESLGLPVAYPVNFESCYRHTMALPRPDPSCAPCNNGRPSNIGSQFQLRITVLGYCRLRALWIHTEIVERGLYSQLVC